MFFLCFSHIFFIFSFILSHSFNYSHFVFFPMQCTSSLLHIVFFDPCTFLFLLQCTLFSLMFVVFLVASMSSSLLQAYHLLCYKHIIFFVIGVLLFVCCRCTIFFVALCIIFFVMCYISFLKIIVIIAVFFFGVGHIFFFVSCCLWLFVVNQLRLFLL